MDYLSENWFVTPLFDVEYKYYQVLGYVQMLNRHFDDNQLFPYFDDLLRHIQNLEILTKAKLDFESGIQSKAFVKSDENYHLPLNDTLKDLQEILAFAEKEFNQCRTRAERALNILMEKVQVWQLGLFNPESFGGMVLISQNERTRIYSYEQRLIQRPNTYFQYKDICTRYAKTVPTEKNIYNLKWELLKSDEIKTGINTYAVQCHEALPHFETVLPLVKNQLLNNNFSQAR